MRGGYIILDFLDINITVDGAGVTIPGLYECIEGNYRKPTLIENLTINNVERAGRFVTFGIDNSDFVANLSISASVNVLTLRVTSDDLVTVIEQ